MTQIAYKTILATPKPYPIMEKEQYIKFLKKRMDSIHSGEVGIYLGRRIIEKGQELYFPFLDIDGQQKLREDEKIASAISNLTLVWNSFKTLGADKYFKIIATGNAGFRLVSNLLLNHKNYQAFIDFIRCEMPELTDLAPTMDLDMPHQFFAYKGSEYQNPKDLVDGHSALILPDDIANETMSPELYKSITAGKPDPYAVINFMEGFLEFRQISDLNALGEFGAALQQYSKILKDIKIDPFNYIKFRKNNKPISVDEMYKRLQEKNILCKVEKRGRNIAISFQGLPCPACGKSTANAVAYPPYYRLKCFNENCPSKKGTSLAKWAGIKNENREGAKVTNKTTAQNIPANFQTVEQARQTIMTSLKDKEDVLLIVTPGVGKTYAALEYLANHMTNKLVIYSSFNKDLQREAYEIIRELSSDHHRFHLLQSREDTCTKKRELHEVISMGYSPAEILCTTCEKRGACEYYKQRENLQNGIYFVTHHMLQYLEGRFPNLDLLILDENLLDGLRLEDSCSERQLRSLSIVLDQKEYSLINQILTLVRNVSNQMMKEEAHPLIINGRKLTPADVMEDSIIGLLSRQNTVSEDAIESDIRFIISKVNQSSKRGLYKKGVDLNAVKWLRGLIEQDHYSYLLITDKGDYFFRVKYLTPIGYRNTPAKILDATGDKRTVQTLLRRKLNLIKSDVEWKSTKTHIKTNTSRGVLKFAKDSDLKRLLSLMIAETSATKIMVITYKFLKERVLRICNEIAPKTTFMDYHFIGPRGVNAFRDCEAVIVIGLPYPNLNSSGQDAYILFPREEDMEMRDSWAESCMLWELTQNIHRIRPIYKTNVDIIIASSYWPPILPEPDKTIDKSRSNNWKDIAIQRLELYVKEFGFLNSDIGYIANVFVKSKRKQANLFREKLFDVVNTYLCLFNTNNLNYQLSLLFGLEDLNNVQDLYSDKLLKNNEIKKDLSKDANSICILILVLYILYYLNLDTIHKFFALNSINHSTENSSLSENISSLIPKDIILSNTRQWAILIIYFKEKYPHFESFKIKLPHTRNHYVEGIGDKTQVLNFYQSLETLGIVEPVDFNSYVRNEKPLLLVDPIPDTFVVAYFPDETRQFVHIGHKNKVHTISFMNDYFPFSKVMTDHEVDNKSIFITNNGKLLAKHSLNAELKKFDIIDIVLVEKLIRNGQAIKKIDMDFLFKTYDLVKDVDSNMCVNQMVKVWEHQRKLIDDLGLRNVIKLEQEMIWIAAKIEQSGIGIDVMGMSEYKESLEIQFRDIGERLYDIFPEDISRGDDGAVMEYLNARYGLGLLNMNIGSLKSVMNSSAAPIIASLLESRSLKKESDDIERYLDMNEDNDRIHGQVNQLNTVTGRFYHPLQTVIKRGPMRSFFRARDGYTFIIADYSQCEPRIIAGLSGDIKSRQIFNQGGDIYMEVAKAITGLEKDECGEFRKVAKIIVLGLNYGMSEYTIYEELKGIGLSLTLDEVRNFIWKYKHTFPGIFEWRDVTVKNAYRTGSIRTVMGRQMFVDQHTKTTSIFNFPVQGSASDGFKLALLHIDRKLKDVDAQIVHIIHDEVIVEVKTGIADVSADIIKKCMERVFTKLIPDISFKVVPEIRNTWTSA